MRLGVIAGIHEDVTRLQQALNVLSEAGCEAIACLGDIVGYSVPSYRFLKSRAAHHTVQLVKRHCQYVVVGNHGLYAVRKLSTEQRVFAYPANWYALDWGTRRELTRAQVWLYDDELSALLTKEEEAYLQTLPEFLVLSVDGLPLMLSHSAYPDLIGDAVSFDPAQPEHLVQHFDFMHQHGCSMGISGHAGRDGMAVYTQTERREIGFGGFPLYQDQSLWLQGSWVANGTYANGVLVLDTTRREIEAIPLQSLPHVVPKWAKC